MTTPWILFDRKRRPDGALREGSVICISCGGNQEIEAHAGEGEGQGVYEQFRNVHALCGDKQIVPRRFVFDIEPESSAAQRTVRA